MKLLSFHPSLRFLFKLPLNLILPLKINKKFVQTHQKATKKDTLAQYQLAQMYFSGLGVLQNLNSARLWANEAAKNGNADAYALLADINLLSDSYFSQELVDARKYAIKAVEMGSTRGKISLAESLINPIAGKTDYQQSIELLNEVNALNNPDYFIAPILLGVIYLDGQGVAKDEKQAQQWFDKANEMTYPGYAEWMAAFRFSEDNTGTVAIDPAKAKKLRVIACEKGKEAGNEMFCFNE
ncbi:hypothetical protein PR729_22090 [Providencia rettgeri]|nr:hypothetical protein PR729_22090 [Providencia rettgeri]